MLFYGPRRRRPGPFPFPQPAIDNPAVSGYNGCLRKAFHALSGAGVPAPQKRDAARPGIFTHRRLYPKDHAMSFLKTSTSFTRLRIIDPVPSSLWAQVPDLLRKNAFADIDELPEERSFGWVAFEDFLDTTFAANPVEKGTYLAFSLRLDTRRVPPAVIKKHHALALKREEAQNREQGKKFVSRERKKELKEQVMLKLRMRFLPVPAEFQVVWNTAESVLYFASTQPKMLDMFEELFIRTFSLHVMPLTPYELALAALPDSAALDTIEPTTFA